MFRTILILSILLLANIHYGQQKLTTDEAVQIALANNYGIQLAKNSSEIARNNTSKYNTGELPTFRVNAGSAYGMNGAEINYHSVSVPGVSTWVGNGVDYNASVSGSYVIYDFEGRKLNKQKLSEELSLAELQERRSVELNILATLISYYNIAQINDNLDAQNEVLEISRERKERVVLQQKYGKNNRLAVLNAVVDINRDSIDYLNLRQNLDNEKRSFNLLLGRPAETTFEIDNEVTFAEDLSLEELLNEALRSNIELLLINQDMDISELDININEKFLKPVISASSSLGLFGGLNDNKSNVKNQFLADFSAGVNLSWNLFDGGGNSVRNKNLKVILDNQAILLEQKKEEIRTDLLNAWASYQNQLYIMEVEERNMETASLNFERTEEQFKLGQLSSVEFRQAQLNKLLAQVNFNRSKFIAKINELSLLQLSGKLRI